MADCVFDIETAPLPADHIPAAVVEALQRSLPEDRHEQWREQLALHAPTASVVAIGMINPQSRSGVALYDDRHGRLSSIAMPEGYSCTQLAGGDETAILSRFWALIIPYERVISYNGRGFDVPFLMQRSLIRGVPLTRNLMGSRYGTRVHLDLADVLTQFGATRRYSLAGWAVTLGVQNPKEGPVRGAEVGAAFEAGRTQEIVEYCMRDVVATARLGERVLRLWSEVLRG